MSLKLFAVFLFLIEFANIDATLPQIACPEYFQYVFEENNQCYGKITLNNLYANSINLEVKLIQTLPVEKGNFGQISFDQEESNFRNGCFVYRIDFPFRNVYPAIKSIILNGNLICQANNLQEVASPRQTILLHHSLKYNFPKETNQQQSSNNKIISNIYLPPTLLNIPIIQQPHQNQIPQNQIPQNQIPQYANQLQINKVMQQDRLPQVSLPQQTQLPQDPQRVERNPLIQTIPSLEQPSQIQSSVQPSLPSNIIPNQNDNRPQTSQPGGVICNLSNQRTASNNDLPENTQFPWVAGIFRKGIIGLNFTCDGSLISAHSVVTSAACLETNNVTSENAVVFLGWNMLDSTNDAEVVIREAEKIIVHPDFYKPGKNNEDIALMHLKKPINFTRNVHPICLWSDFKTNKKQSES